MVEPPITRALVSRRVMLSCRQLTDRGVCVEWARLPTGRRDIRIGDLSAVVEWSSLTA